MVRRRSRRDDREGTLFPEPVRYLPDTGFQHYHAWRLWKIDVPVEAEGWLEFCVRTWDSSNNTEPTFVRSAWK